MEKNYQCCSWFLHKNYNFDSINRPITNYYEYDIDNFHGKIWIWMTPWFYLNGFSFFFLVLVVELDQKILRKFHNIVCRTDDLCHKLIIIILRVCMSWYYKRNYCFKRRWMTKQNIEQFTASKESNIHKCFHYPYWMDQVLKVQSFSFQNECDEQWAKARFWKFLWSCFRFSLVDAISAFLRNILI